MSALDFPASPSVGQAFAGGNGIVYTWNGLLWVASGASAGGDFYAINTGADIVIGTTPITLPINTVLTGNSGGWYATGGGSIGRYTPPAGRYQISAGLSFFGAGAGNTHGTISIRKNGVIIVQEVAASNASAFILLAVEGTFDTNGTDYFEVFVNATAAASGGRNGYFGAYPISGIKGPPGDPGMPGFRLLQRTVVSSAVPAVEITNISSDINDIEIRFDLTPTVADKILQLRFYDETGALNVSSLYRWAMVMSQAGAATGAAPQSYTSTSSGTMNCVNLHYWSAGNGVRIASGGIRGDCTIYNIRDTTRYKGVTTRSTHPNNAGSQINGNTGWGSLSGVLGVTGVRLFFDTGDVGSGTFSVWGSP